MSTGSLQTSSPSSACPPRIEIRTPCALLRPRNDHNRRQVRHKEGQKQEPQSGTWVCALAEQPSPFREERQSGQKQTDR